MFVQRLNKYAKALKNVKKPGFSPIRKPVDQKKPLLGVCVIFTQGMAGSSHHGHDRRKVRPDEVKRSPVQTGSGLDRMHRILDNTVNSV